jgi:hypothetical protein
LNRLREVLEDWEKGKWLLGESSSEDNQRKLQEWMCREITLEKKKKNYHSKIREG